MSAEILSRPDSEKISIDFSRSRRTSFLPEGLETTQSSLKTAKMLGSNEDDDLFVYVGGTEHISESKPINKFCTGSKYLGQWNELGIYGKGIYKYPHGVIYDGYFNKNGQFHGTGILVYPNGQKIEGIWRNGKLGPEPNFVTKAGVVMHTDYCVMPDRRFQVELENDFNPATHEYLTDEQPPARVIPDGCYDLVEGYYDPIVKTVYAYPKEKKSSAPESQSSSELTYKGEEDSYSALRQMAQKSKSELRLDLIKMKLCDEQKIVSWIPSPSQEEWIRNNCRKSWDEPTCYRPDLYEEWTKGNVNNELKTDMEPIVESTLTTLRLTSTTPNEEPNGFISFVTNRQDQPESVAIDMLIKMFFEKTDVPKIETAKDLSVISKSQQVQSD